MSKTLAERMNHAALLAWLVVAVSLFAVAPAALADEVEGATGASDSVAAEAVDVADGVVEGAAAADAADAVGAAGAADAADAQAEADSAASDAAEGAGEGVAVPDDGAAVDVVEPSVGDEGVAASNGTGDETAVDDTVVSDQLSGDAPAMQDAEAPKAADAATAVSAAGAADATPATAVAAATTSPATVKTASISSMAVIKTQATGASSATTAPAAGWYTIKTKLNSAFVLQVNGNNSRAGTSIVLQKSGKATGQAFKLAKTGSYYRILAGTGFKSRIIMNADGTVALGQSTGNDSKYRLEVNADGSVRFVNVATGLVLSIDGTASAGARLCGKALATGSTSQAFSLAARSGIVVDGVYAIRTGLSGKRAISLKGASLKAGAALTIQKYASKLYQKWQVKSVAGQPNYYTIESLATGYRITGTKGKPVRVKASTGTSKQWWTPVGAHGQVFWKNVATGQMLSLSNASSAEGTVVKCLASSTKASARWTGKSVKVLGSGFYDIQNAVNRSIAVEVADGSSADGANVRLAKDAGDANQKWYYDAAKKTFANVSSGKMLTVVNGSTVSGANIAQQTPANTAQQKWEVSYAGKGNFIIASKLGYSLVLSAKGCKAGKNVCDITYKGAGRQKWHLVETTGEDATTIALQFTLDQMARMQKSGNEYYSTTTLKYLRSVLNPNNGSKYKFVDLRKNTGVSGALLDKFIATNGSTGKMAGLGDAFAKACKKHNLNEVYLVAHAILESGWGKSELASGYKYGGGYIDGTYYKKGTYYNFFGIGAYDNSPLSGGRKKAIIEGWNSPSKAVTGAAKWIAENYVYRSSYAQPTLYAMKWDYAYTKATGTRGWHQYATSTTWADSIGRLMEQCYSAVGFKPTLSYIKPSYKQ